MVLTNKELIDNLVEMQSEGQMIQDFILAVDLMLDNYIDFGAGEDLLIKAQDMLNEVKLLIDEADKLN